MRKTVLCGIAAAALSIAAMTPAKAFVPNADPALAARAAAPIVDVKQKWHQPHGWHHGRKAGWGSGHVPPGHRKHWKKHRKHW